MEHVTAPAWALLAYLVSGVLFILALRGLSSPETSRSGNRYGMAGMLIAVVTTLVMQQLAGIVVGISHQPHVVCPCNKSGETLAGVTRCGHDRLHKRRPAEPIHAQQGKRKGVEVRKAAPWNVLGSGGVHPPARIALHVLAERVQIAQDLGEYVPPSRGLPC